MQHDVQGEFATSVLRVDLVAVSRAVLLAWLSMLAVVVAGLPTADVSERATALYGAAALFTASAIAVCASAVGFLSKEVGPVATSMAHQWHLLSVDVPEQVSKQAGTALVWYTRATHTPVAGGSLFL